MDSLHVFNHSEPLFAFEIGEHCEGHAKHKGEDAEIAPVPLELGYKLGEVFSHHLVSHLQQLTYRDPVLSLKGLDIQLRYAVQSVARSVHCR